MARYETLIYEQAAGQVMRLTLNRPERLNAMSLEMLAEFDQVMDEFEQDAGASVLFIRGAGRAFSAGYDLADTQLSGAGFRVATDRRAMHRVAAHWLRLFDLPKPTIAQVHGHCVAGATELVGHCDIAFAAHDAIFGNPAGRVLGILPTMGMWPALMGPRRTKEYFFTGDTFSGKQAAQWGLVNRAFPPADLEAATLEYARRAAMVPLELLTLHKAAVNRYLEVTGIRAAQQSACDLDVIAHQTETVRNWVELSRQKGLREAIEERDRPFKKLDL
ncbi:MAG TPA: enoyl-CoA hydratase-related protein [Candidatus Binataceae bacterium]